MKRVVFSLAALLLVQSASPIKAQEAPETQIEFIQRLRAKNYNDLAMEHIEKLAKTPKFPLANILQLESARTMLALAREREPESRPPLFAEARKVLEAFVAKNPGGPDAAQGRLEIARLAAYQGQSLLTRAI